MCKKIFWILFFVPLIFSKSLFAADTTIKGTTTDSSVASLEVTNSANTSLAFFRNDGNIGIGTASPTKKLHVSSGDVRIDNMTTAGFVKNDATGILTGGHTTTATPAGTDTQVQFNDSDAFGGDAGFVYNKTTDTATLGVLNLTTPLGTAYGGTGAATPAAARSNLSAAALGANSDITSLTGLTTALSIAQGGTGAATQAGAANNILPTQTGNNGKFLKTDGTDVSFATVTASPGGTDTQMQFNDGGSLGGDAGFVYNKTTDTAALGTLSLTNALAVANGGTGSTNGSISGTGALSFTAGGTNQNLSLAPSGTGSLALNGPARLSSTLSILEGGTSPTKYTIFTGGDQTVDINYTLPASTANGFLRNTDGTLTWQTPTAAAGGANTQVQFNDSGALGGDAGFVYNSGTTTATIATLNLTNDLAVTEGGTGASTASGARTNLSAAALGANSDITSLAGLTTALSVAQGGTGSTTASGARSNLSAAALGANSDITSLTGLTTALSIAQGGTGAATQAGAANNILPTQTGNNGKFLKTDGTDVSFATVTASPTGANTQVQFNNNGSLGADAGFTYNSGTTTATIATLNLTNDLAVTEGGTGASTASVARSNLSAAALGANSDITSLAGLTTALSIAQGGTGSTIASGARSNLSAAASGANSDITSLAGLTTALSVAQGGTGSTTASGARSNLSAASSGTNSDITSLAGLTTALSVAQGGTGSTTASGARSNLSAAALGANSDITSLTGLTTALSIAQGGTGATTATAATNNILPTQTGNSGKFLTTNGTNTSWGASSGTNTDKIHITMFTEQASTVSKSDPAETVAITNIGTTPVGFGSAANVRMDGFTTIRLIAKGANKAGQSGMLTIKIRDFTDSTDLVSLTFSDTTVQFREATASIALTGLHKLVAQISSDTNTDDPLIGNIAIMLEM